MALYWFIPALVKRRVGSLCGTTEEDGTVKRDEVRQTLIEAMRARTYY